MAILSNVSLVITLKSIFFVKIVDLSGYRKYIVDLYQFSGILEAYANLSNNL